MGYYTNYIRSNPDWEFVAEGVPTPAGKTVWQKAALSQLITDRKQLIEDGRLLKARLSDPRETDSQIEALTQEREDVTTLIRQLVESNAAVALSQKEYNRKYDRLVKRSGKLSAKLAELQKEHDARENAAVALSGFLFEIGELEDMDIQFRPQRFAKTVERITVHSDGRLVFRFLVGKEIPVELR